MDLSKLKPEKGSIKKKKRIGRGQGSGKAGTATRGHKGQKSRSGYSRKFGFEGGQMPLHRRVPKYGFTNPSRKVYKGVNLDVIQEVAEKMKTDKIDVDTLVKAGFVSRKSLVKILGKGELKMKLDVKAHAFSKSAREAIESKKGTIEKITY